MMREVVGAVMAAFVGLLLLWFILPMLNTTYELIKQNVDMTNPTNQTLILLGDGVYSILGYIVIVVVGYLIFAYATRNVPVDL